MSDDNPLEKELGRPLRPALPPAPSDLDDEPLTRPAHAHVHSPAHWPDEEAAMEAALEPPGDFTITEGDLIKTLEWYFPLFWAACLIIISYIGIYYGVDQLHGANPLPPAWF